MANHSLGKKPLTNIQPKTLLTKLHYIPSGPVISHHREDTNAGPLLPVVRKLYTAMRSPTSQSPFFQAKN